ncbi:hypothetical protein [Microbacterium sp. No. 7]|uniref:hypothetical protein n=1 Tax=Microbacterium sp. No. 7 TaxID=1714373 RepID=UPI0006D2B9D5|nr:hypothetical protein [Microbacterium sp. No. 7]ALJ22024.1 hypothetical protein AOA12_19870 [Microbacterium sp. No. 7]
MDSITSRILAGEIVLTKDATGFAATGFASSILNSLTGRPRSVVRAFKKDGTGVDARPTDIIGRTEIDGHDVVKVAVSLDNGRRCDHYETDTHGTCYACGAYVRASDAGRYL